MNDDYEHKRGMDRGNAKIDRQTMIAAMQMKGIGRQEKGGPSHPPLWLCHSTAAQQTI